MADEVNGSGAGQELPQIPQAPAGEGDPRYTPGLSNVLIQPNAGRGWWDAIEQVMKGSTSPETFLRLTNVTEEEIIDHINIQYALNLGRYGNGRLEEVMWSMYNLRCSEGGMMLGMVDHMISGQRYQKNQDWQEKRRGAFSRARGNGALGDNEQRLQGE